MFNIDRKYTLVFVLSLFSLSVNSFEAAASIYYVSPQGSDENPGTADKPFAHPQKAAGLVKPGDTVIIREGVYTDTDKNGHVLFVKTKVGDDQNWITFKADENSTVIFDGMNSASSAFTSDRSSYLILKGIELKSATSDGVRIYNSHNVKLIKNKIHHIGSLMASDCSDSSGRSGISISAFSTYCTIDSNEIYSNGREPNLSCNTPKDSSSHNYRHDHGIYAQGAHHVVVNNVIYDHPAGYAIKVDGYLDTNLAAGSFSHMIINNTFGQLTRPDSDAGGVIRLFNNATFVEGYGTMKDPVMLLQNNVFYSPGGRASDTAVRITTGRVYEGHVIRYNVTTSNYLYNEDLGEELKGRVNAYDNKTSATTSDLLLEDPNNNKYNPKSGSITLVGGFSQHAPAHDILNNARDTISPGLGAYTLPSSENFIPKVQSLELKSISAP